MLDERIAYLNGDYVECREVKVHALCHSLGRGTAIFEFLSFHDTARGPAVFRLDEHAARISRTANLIGFELSVSEAELREAVLQTIRRNNLREGFLKVMAFHSRIVFELTPPRDKLDVAVFAVDPHEDLGGVPMPPEKGVTACVSSWRKLHPQTVPVETKAAANYLNGMLASSEAKARGFDAAILLDTQGFVAEGATEAVFLVRDEVLRTPVLGTILGSITRRSLLELADVLGVQTQEERVTLRALRGADEVFLACTPFKITPVRQVDEQELSTVPGPVTARLASVLKEVLSGRDSRFEHWLFPV